MNKLKKFSLKFLVTLIFFSQVSQYKINAEISNTPSNLSTEYLEIKPKFSYILGPGDIIKIDFGIELEELKTISVISERGTIFVPRLEEIYVSGLTIKELKDLLNEKYNEFILEPDLKVSIQFYREVKAYVLGEVNNPGLYNLRSQSLTNNLDYRSGFINDTSKLNESSNENYEFEETYNKGIFKENYLPTLFDALRTAGGITLYSDLTNIEIKRVNPISEGGGYISANINFVEALLEGKSFLNIRILNDDVIKVKRNENPNSKQINQAIRTNLNNKFIKVFVSGRVINPGEKKVSKTSALNDVIAISGGTKVIKGKILMVRYKSDGEVERRTFAYSRKSKPGNYKNPFLRDGDIIMVQRGPFASTTEVLSDVTEPLKSFVNSYLLLKVLQDL